MNRGHLRHRISVAGMLSGFLIVMMVLLAACDSLEPDAPDRLVAEGFLTTGSDDVVVKLSRTRPLQEPFPRDGTQSAVTDASAFITFNGTTHELLPDEAVPGRYQLNGTADLSAGRAFAFEATWQGQEVYADGALPPPVEIDSFSVSITEAPIQAVLFDSVFVDPAPLDSLQLDSLRTGAEEGFVYPVEITLWWEDVEKDYWVRTRLQPDIRAGGALDNFFLRPEDVQQEAEAKCPEDAACSHSTRSWTGVYGVPVQEEDEPLPAHSVLLALIRSDQTYAQFAVSRDDPARRDPVSNVEGGLGIVTGLALDTLRIQIPQ